VSSGQWQEGILGNERRKNNNKKLIGFRRKNKVKPTCGKDGLATKKCGNQVIRHVEQARVLLPGEPWWSAHRDAKSQNPKKIKKIERKMSKMDGLTNH